MPVRGGKEEWQQERIFRVSSGCFWAKKRPNKYCKMTMIALTCGPQCGSELFGNQPEHFPGKRGRHTRKKEERRTV